MQKKWIGLSLCLLLSLTGCGSTYDGTKDGSGIAMDSALNSGADGFGSYDTSQKVESVEIIHSGQVPEDTDEENMTETEAIITFVEEKLVYTCDIQIETKAYDDSYQNLQSLFDKYGVVIQSETQRDNDYDWYYEDSRKDSASLSATIECRVPSKQYKEFVSALNSLGEDTKVTSQTIDVQNISQQYYDNQTQIEALKIQEERLLSMLESATTVDDMILIEDRLQEVQYELSSLQTEVMYMDMDVAYSYVTIYLDEVMEFGDTGDDTFFGRVWEEMKDAWDYGVEMIEKLLSFVFHLIPFVIFIFVPGVFILRLLLFLLKKILKIDIFGKLKGKLQRKQ